MRLYALIISVIAATAFSSVAYGAVGLYQVSVPSGAEAPAFVNYTLNCAADVTVRILPCDDLGTPTGPAIRTASFPGQSRGKHQFIWVCTDDSGGRVPVGLYVARIEASCSQAQWNPIVGLWKADASPDQQFAPRPLPSFPNDVDGFYGVAINCNSGSAYRGRIYLPHKSRKAIDMYDPDGAYIGEMNDTGITWGGSAPWDICVADDDYVYVSDRSNQRVYCLMPDGTGWVSVSPSITYSRAIACRVDPEGMTHVFITGGSAHIYEITVSQNHQTWGTPRAVATVGYDNTAIYGLWVSADLSTLYVCYTGVGPAEGITRWQRMPDGTYQMDTFWPPPGANLIQSPVIDVAMAQDQTFLWATRMDAYVADDDPGTPYYDERRRSIHKVSLATGSTVFPPDADYDVVTYGHMCAADPVGNVAVAFGKDPATWGQRYCGIFAEPGTSTASADTTMFEVTDTSDWFWLIEGSESWTFSNPSYPGELPADDTSTASVTFQVLTAAGAATMTGCTMDLTSLGYGIEQVTSIAPHPTDPLIAVCTKAGIRAKHGVACGMHNLTVTPSGTMGDGRSYAMGLSVAGSQLAGLIRHNVHMEGVDGAVIHASGGGIPGQSGPLSYMSGASDSSGNVTLDISEGSYQVWAEKPGYGSTAPVSITVPSPATPPGPAVDVGSIYLRPLTISEAKALPDAGKVNVQGVCFAEPCSPHTGSNPPAVPGLHDRYDQGVYQYQWYVCDPNDPSNGMLMMMAYPLDQYDFQMDDPLGVDQDGNSTYVGRRPAIGETVMLTGMLDTPSGHERRVKADMTDIADLPFNRTYINGGMIGGLPSSPVVVTIPGFSHGSISGDFPGWGRYASVADVVVVRNVPDGSPWNTGDPIPYSVIADHSGHTAEVVYELPLTLGITWPSPGGTYTFKGPTGRRNRYGNGCIRARSNADMSLTITPPGPPEAIGTARQQSDGMPVNTVGVLTRRWTSFFYIESPDRSSGIRVDAAPGSYLSRGDIVHVVGTLSTVNGERVVQPDLPPFVTGVSAVPWPLGMANRDVGGAGSGGGNNGVTNGRGALNLGLLIKTHGVVTHTDSGYFYIWDGSNAAGSPIDDGSGHYGIRVRSSTLVSVDSLVEVIGISSADSSVVSGSVIPVVMPVDTGDLTVNAAQEEIASPPGGVLPGWNLIALPGVPANPDPTEVLAPVTIDNKLFRWEALTGSLISYDSWSPESFGGMLVGDGFWLQSAASADISYQGRYRTDDQWISLPAPGWALVGQPFDHDTLWSDVKVHNGLETVSMEEACRTREWMESTAWWWDNSSQSLCDMGLPDEYPSSDRLRAWHGYWVQGNTPNISVVIPAGLVAP